MVQSGSRHHRLSYELAIVIGKLAFLRLLVHLQHWLVQEMRSLLVFSCSRAAMEDQWLQEAWAIKG